MKNVLGTTYGIGASGTFTAFLAVNEKLSRSVCVRSYADQEKVAQMAKFVWELAHWKVFATFTFRWSASVESAKRCFERFVRRTLPNISVFFVIELHPGGHGGHVHALFDRDDFPRKSVWREWLKRYGINRVEPINGFQCVCDYVSKYVLKDHAWWNFSLSRAAYNKISLPTNQGNFSLSLKRERSPTEPATGVPDGVPFLPKVDSGASVALCDMVTGL